MALGRLLSAAAVVLLASSALASPLAALSRETLNRAYSPTPGGAYVRKDCIYTVCGRPVDAPLCPVHSALR